MLHWARGHGSSRTRRVDSYLTGGRACMVNEQNERCAFAGALECRRLHAPPVIVILPRRYHEKAWNSVSRSELGYGQP